MKILIIQNTLSAYNIPLFDLIGKQNNIELSVFCAYSELSKSAHKYDHSVLHFNIVKSHCGFIGNIFNSVGVPGPSSDLMENIESFNPDVIAIDGLSSVGNAMQLFLSSIGKKYPIIWWSLGAIPERDNNIRSKIGDAIQKFCTHKASAIFSYGTHSKRYYESLGVPSESIVVGHNTIDEQDVINNISSISEDDLTALRNELAIKYSDRVSVYCGRMLTQKKIDVLLTAFSQLQDAKKPNDRHLVLIGDGPERENLESLASELGIVESVSFVGAQHAKLSNYFLLGDFCVLPGLGGLAINHAFAHSLPVISGPADGTELDLVITDQTGIYLDFVNVDRLKFSLQRLFDDTDLCRSMGKKANELVVGEYSLENYARRFIETAERCSKSI
ncbi:Glycosyltransferase family 4 protein [Vibrio chagasii]|nr:Glycosyltransferase family 4 protein [Vibrio chagasii]CAH7091211.1 Glycosyltransferase family 4 protein [Vibrio chagasii]CAH7116312.1 Glycosyltransferase family 4 protein [Vibrio chagasii]